MTSVYITIDTEYSSSLAARKGSGSREENFEKSIAGITPSGSVGIGYQLDIFDHYDLKAVFFVDPMPALLWGVEAISDVIGPIIERGHDVQLHLHAEWLALSEANNPLGKRTGTHIKDFTYDEQCQLIDYARSTLMAAGAPRPIAFRAGNYGANDDTLRALAELGFSYDTNHCPGIAESDCAISLGPEDRRPVQHCGVVEVPIGCIGSFGARLRHAQITALSSAETLAAIRHARFSRNCNFTLVSHSFELLSRDRTRVNQIVKQRFERLCAGLAKLDDISTTTYAQNPPTVSNLAPASPILPHNLLRSGLRLAKQATANVLYGTR